jgi:hypothetical protein
MPLIDIRNPFDWVIMNALNYAYFTGNGEDEGGDTVDRINKVMEQLFKRMDEN